MKETPFRCNPHHQSGGVMNLTAAGRRHRKTPVFRIARGSTRSDDAPKHETSFRGHQAGESAFGSLGGGTNFGAVASS
jgi:hypothetical protein